MQNLINEPPVKKNYDFVDNIRCIAMIFIVMEHATYFEPNVYLPHGGIREFIYLLTIQFSKFGTVCFFLLAGFLIGDKFTDYTPSQYLKRRIDSTIWPWLFWSLCFIFLANYDIIVNQLILRQDPVEPNAYKNLWESVTTTYLYTNYWFIPNFLFCISLLLIFKRYLYNYVLGGILLLFTIFYSVNIYFTWIRSSHTIAILGFVFFLWLGAQLNKNWGKVNMWLSKIPVGVWWALSVATLLLSMGETKFLQSLNSTDPYNSLRFSNIIYSMCCFFLLLKFKTIKFIHYLKPRETTYGVYLIHYVILAMLLPKIFDGFHIDVPGLPLPVILCYQLAKFFVVYSITLLVVMKLNKTRLKWMIGR
jgi:hypothetical protein